ncbi:hypothetical protein [Candidatus Palauibacter sp.]|uniref:hypothetical protein n=1 Tax=Candidatus Palauibacter sp. TaxID=3101350 RepID=UPI003B023EC6
MSKARAGAVVAAWALVVPVAAAAQEREWSGPITESAAARALMDNGGTRQERERALALALDLGPRAGPELKAAVIEAAWAEWRVDRGTGAAIVGGLQASETGLDYMQAVAEGRDPRGIPLLIAAPVGSRAIPSALADFGPALTFAPVLAAAADPEGHRYIVTKCLTALRFMVEEGALSPRQLARVRQAVRERLHGPQDYSIVAHALRLGFALGDSELRRRIEELATDRAAVEEILDSSYSDTYHLNYVQEQARAALSGDPLPPYRLPPRPPR